MHCKIADIKYFTRFQCEISVAFNQRGSTIVIALLVLVLLSLGGVTATKRAITESFTVRNTAIHKQNLSLAEAAAREGIVNILAQELEPDWIHSRGTTLDHDDLDDNNSIVVEAAELGLINTLNVRGENSDAFRYYAIEIAEISALEDDRITDLVIKVIGVYNSSNFGRKTVEIGMIKRFIHD